MAILNAQAWSCFVDADTDTEFDRQPEWYANPADPCLFDADGGPLAESGAWAPRWAGEVLEIDGGWAESTIYFAGWVNMKLVNLTDLIRLYEGSFATLHSYIYANNSNGNIEWRNGAGTVIAVATGGFPQGANKMFHIALRLTVDDSAGVIQLWIDGEQRINASGLDTKNGGTGVIDSLRLFGANTNEWWWAEPIIWNASGDAPTGYFGLHRVRMLKPDGDVSVAFTPQGAGSNYVEVDEQAADDDGTYNTSSSSADKDRLSTESLPTEVTDIYSVQAKVLARDDADTDSIYVGLNSGTESLSGAKALTSSYAIYEGPLETVDPNTASQWTESNVNATDLVYEHV